LAYNINRKQHVSGLNVNGSMLNVIFKETHLTLYQHNHMHTL